MKNYTYSKTIIESITEELSRLVQYFQPLFPKFQTYYPTKRNTILRIKPLFTLLEISLSVRKKEGRKNNKNRPLFRSRNHSISLERERDEETKREGKRRGQYSRRKEFDEREFSLPRRTHVQTPERILSYAGDPFHRARHGAPFGASVQRPWLLARGGANELRGSRFARNTWHLADATGCERDVGAILAGKFEESLAEREGVNENVCR